MLDEKGCLVLEDALVLSVVTIMAASTGFALFFFTSPFPKVQGTLVFPYPAAPLPQVSIFEVYGYERPRRGSR